MRNLHFSKTPGFSVCDGKQGKLLSLHRSVDNSARWLETPLSEISIPIKAQIVDIDNKGRLDIVVANLGELPPTESLKSEVLLLERQESGAFIMGISIQWSAAG